MNIAMVVYSHYSRDARVRRYAEALAKKDFKVDVICLKEDYQPKQRNVSLIQYPIPRRRFGRLWYILEYFSFFVYSTITLSLNHLMKQYQVIHIHNMPDFLVFSAILPKLFGAKVILDMHDPMPELYMSKFHKTEESLMVKWLEWLEGISFGFADKILTANEQFKYIFLERCHFVRGVTSLRNKISVILNCPDPKLFESTHNPRPTTHNHNFTLLYMGTVEDRFGLEIVIDAIPSLIKKIPNLRFIIIPKLEEEGDYIRSLKIKVQSTKLEEYIHFLIPLPLEKIAVKLQEADVGIVLAKNGIFTESIFPVKLLEFVQMGIPVIATKTKALSQYFDNDMIYFLEKNNSGEFSKSVLKLFKDKNARTRLATNAKSYLQKYNWPNEEKKYLQLLLSLRGA